jgi:hypothetical protein
LAEFEPDSRRCRSVWGLTSKQKVKWIRLKKRGMGCSAVIRQMEVRGHIEKVYW